MSDMALLPSVVLAQHGRSGRRVAGPHVVLHQPVRPPALPPLLLTGLATLHGRQVRPGAVRPGTPATPPGERALLLDQPAARAPGATGPPRVGAGPGGAARPGQRLLL